MSGPVLITGARAPVALDIARAFTAAGCAVRLADSVTPWAARWSNEKWPVDRLPSPRHAYPAFRQALLDLVGRYDPPLIVPTCEEVFYVSAAAAADGYAGRVFAPPLETLRTLHSKQTFATFARELGLAAPQTWRITDADDLSRLPRPPDQLVLKPEYSRFAVSALVRPNARALAGVRPSPDHPWVAQAFVAGEEICLWSAAQGGRITALAAYRPRWRHGRSAAYAFEAFDCPAAEDVARRIASATAMTGHLSFDIILTPAGKAVPIECNPRAVSGVHLFDGGAPLACAIIGEAGGDALRPTAELRYLAPAMALLGVAPAISGRWHEYVRDWRRGADAISRPGDRLPLAGTLLDAARFALVGLSRRRSPTGQTTDDIEWNGEPIGMTPLLFDPRDPPAGAWPDGCAVERAFIEGGAQGGIRSMVANATTEWRALRSHGRLFPITINHGEIGGSYVCLPHSAYALYAREELDLVDLGAAMRMLARPAIGMLGRLLRAAGINRIVHIDNWLLSTNLHGNWPGADLPAIRALLCTLYPRHILAIRSLDEWSCPALLAAARADGWTLVPSRQIWVTDDLAHDWRPRNAFGNDRRLLRRSGLAIETIDAMMPADAATIAHLYHQLYVGKYSALNPIFTAAFVALTHRVGMIRYRVARAGDGAIRAVAGCYVRGDILTPPVVGYDTSRPQREGLYRIASYLFAEAALEQGVRLNGSAGAAGFKRLRGARGVIEYSAMYTHHLGPAPRLAVGALAGGLERAVVPMMRRKGL